MISDFLKSFSEECGRLGRRLGKQRYSTISVTAPARRCAAFANREAQALLQGNRVISVTSQLHVVPGITISIRPAVSCPVTSVVRNKLRTIPRKTACDARLFLRQHVRFALNFVCGVIEPGLQITAALHVFFSVPPTASQRVRSNPSSSSFLNISMPVTTFSASRESHDFHFFADLHLAAFDSPVTTVPGRKSENVSIGSRTVYLHRERQRNVRSTAAISSSIFFSHAACVERLQRRTAHHGNRVAREW